MKERIVLLIKAKNYTAAQFADEIGVQKSGISHIISGRNNPSLDFVQKILQRFPEVNMDWLIMGKGPMFSGDSDRQLPVATPLFTVQGVENREPDLFSQEISPVSGGTSQLNVDNPVISPTPEIEPIQEDIASSKEQPSISDTKIPEEVVKPSTGIPKKIEKVLFFYSDKTFQEYFPENQTLSI
jgi:transcriptional regulator with XRE-family HTH domain